MSHRNNPKLDRIDALINAAVSNIDIAVNGGEVDEAVLKDALLAVKCYIEVAKPAVRHAKPSLVDKAVTTFMLSQLPASGEPGAG